MCEYYRFCNVTNCIHMRLHVNYPGTADDIVNFGYGKIFKTKEELKKEADKKKEDLKMKFVKNYNDKRKKKEWEK